MNAITVQYWKERPKAHSGIVIRQRYEPDGLIEYRYYINSSEYIDLGFKYTGLVSGNPYFGETNTKRKLMRYYDRGPVEHWGGIYSNVKNMKHPGLVEWVLAQLLAAQK